MARPRSLLRTLEPLIADFTAKMASLVEMNATTRARDAVMRAFGVGDRRKITKPVSAERRTISAARVLQGRYLGALRGLSKGDRTKVKAERAKSGVESALKLAARLR